MSEAHVQAKEKAQAFKKSVSMTKEDKSEAGGLTKKGREKYNRETGSNLKALSLIHI